MIRALIAFTERPVSTAVLVATLATILSSAATELKWGLTLESAFSFMEGSIVVADHDKQTGISGGEYFTVPAHISTSI